jgi:hypothetical protein
LGVPKEIVKFLGNVIAFTFLACGKAFEFLFRHRVGDHTRARAQTRARPAADRVVESHHVLSGRLMDAPTGRLYPSSRHRVPPWLPPR